MILLSYPFVGCFTLCSWWDVRVPELTPIPPVSRLPVAHTEMSSFHFQMEDNVHDSMASMIIGQFLFGDSQEDVSWHIACLLACLTSLNK